ncbi:MAG: endolytic transglycosylase MltG [Chlorobium phaeobacteroides]|jgi:UPF0755 protein|nr:endolytic transglycosylase MltG [Chlorobium phaeobacteroides]
MLSDKSSAQKTLFAGLFLLFLSLCGIFFIPGLNTSGIQTRLVVHRGSGFMAIADTLRRNEAVKNRWQVVLTGRMIPGLHKIKPGRYAIPPGLSNFGLLRYLHTHHQDEVRITIPEGLEQREIARRMAGKLDMDSSRFMKAAKNAALLSKYRISGQSAEGYLFPGTYDFAWGSTPDEVAGFLIGRFRLFYSDSLQRAAASKGLTETSLLTLASIVEAETPLDEEKPLVAGVYLNRLKKGMRLQADPTVQYALGGTPRHLYYKDLAIDSPYNTYRYGGLPPGPICNPGTASILAVLNPEETGFIYFVATGKGGHYFAETIAAHHENIRKYKAAKHASLP